MTIRYTNPTPAGSEITQPRPALRAPRPLPPALRPRPKRASLGLIAFSALLSVLVLACAACSLILVTLGPERVLALRDQVLGETPEKRIEAVAQIVDLVIRGEETWPVPDKGRLTILLMGVDRRAAQGDVPTRSDAITLITIDPNSHTAAMLSIPRDLYVPLAGMDRVDRINTAYFFGQANQLPGGGAQTAKDTITWNLGIPVHKHVIINFEGFKRAIDALGGIDIDVPTRIVDNAYPTEDYGFEQLVIEPGLQHMDGTLALKYVRTRHQDSDFGRLQRQQQVILAVRDKALSLDVLAQLPQLLDAVHGFYETDLSVAELASIAKVWSELPRENIAAYRIDQTMTQGWTTPTGASVLIPIREAIAPVVTAFLGQSETSASTP
ncbi:MAG TPA: LCP family protein [Anaerolineae bacterium]|nr:LCP family protein [Anaerolineae bacterium]